MNLMPFFPEAALPLPGQALAANAKERADYVDLMN